MMVCLDLGGAQATNLSVLGLIMRSLSSSGMKVILFLYGDTTADTEPCLRRGMLEASTYLTFVSCRRIHVDYLDSVAVISGSTVLSVGSMCEAPSSVSIDALEAASNTSIIDGLIPDERQVSFLVPVLCDS